MRRSDSPYATISVPRERGDGHPVAVGERDEQGAIQLELPHQVRLRQRLARHRQQRERQQVDRSHRRRGIDVAHDALGELVHRRREPRRARLLIEAPRAPLALVAVEDLLERDRLAEIHVHLAEALPQHPPRAEESPDALLLLGPPRELADVGRTLDQALVAEIDRHEHHRARGIGEEAAHGHQQHPGLRLQQPPGAAATALDEVLDRVPAAMIAARYFMNTTV